MPAWRNQLIFRIKNFKRKIWCVVFLKKFQSKKVIGAVLAEEGPRKINGNRTDQLVIRQRNIAKGKICPLSDTATPLSKKSQEYVRAKDQNII